MGSQTPRISGSDYSRRMEELEAKLRSRDRAARRRRREEARKQFQEDFARDPEYYRLSSPPPSDSEGSDSEEQSNDYYENLDRGRYALFEHYLNDTIDWEPSPPPQPGDICVTVPRMADQMRLFQLYPIVVKLPPIYLAPSSIMDGAHATSRKVKTAQKARLGRSAALRKRIKDAKFLKKLKT
jgi:hypothetical protein